MPAANRELTTLLHPVDALVPGECELFDQPVDAWLVSDLDQEAAGARRIGRDTLGEPERRHADEPPAFEHVERTSALAHEVRRWSETALVGNAPRREQTDPFGSQKPAGCVREVARIRILGEEAHRAVPWRAGEDDPGNHERYQGLRNTRARRPSTHERLESVARCQLARESLECSGDHGEGRNERFRRLHRSPGSRGRESTHVSRPAGATPNHHPL